MSSLYRTPDTTALVGALKQRLQASERSREDLERQLEQLTKSHR